MGILARRRKFDTRSWTMTLHLTLAIIGCTVLIPIGSIDVPMLPTKFATTNDGTLCRHQRPCLDLHPRVSHHGLHQR